jgi:serine/threonine-protein kinase
MPDAVGKPFEEVVVPLDEAGVVHLDERRASEEVPAGIVIEQFPEPGVRVTGADEVRFVVSTGPDPRPVPPTAGMSPEDAAYTLGRSGFAAVEEVRPGDTVPVGTVMGTEPAQDQVRPRDEVVTVVVSGGPAPVPVPNLVGNGQEEAVSRLVGVSLVANVTGGPFEGGVVVAQAPAPGEQIPPGGLVTIEVADG